MNRLLFVAVAALLCSHSMRAQAVTDELAFNEIAAPAADSAQTAPSEGVAEETAGADAIVLSPDARWETVLHEGSPEMFSPEPLEEIEVDPLHGDGAGQGTLREPPSDQDTGRTQVEPRTKLKLLPDNMSWFERTMWGEDGVLRSVGIASPLTPEVRKSELGVRRTMLTMHQIGGFVTLGLMAGAVVYGQRYLDNFQRNDRSLHQTFVTATIVSYGLTAALAAFSPPPFIRRNEISTTSIHKTLAWIHFAGMIVTPILGSMINRRGTDFLAQARLHQVSAYITTAVFTAAMVVMTF